MKIEDAIFGRRSIREFKDEKVSDETIYKIINAGIFAPSACNFQAWKFILIDNQDIKDKLVTSGASYVINKAQQGILVLYRNDLMVTGYKHKDYIQSASAAIQNMLLMAYSLGVSTCWLCDLPSSELFRKLLDIPSNFDVIAYISLGYAKTGTGSDENEMLYHYGNENAFRIHKRRYSLEQVVCHNRFQIVDGDVTGFTLKNKKEKSIFREIIHRMKVNGKKST